MAGTHAYQYLRPSRVGDGGRCELATSGGRTASGPAAHPHFFRGFLAEPEIAATGLLAVANVARTRYYQPLAAAGRDPVVTCGGDRLRFESFSGCCGVYGRRGKCRHVLAAELARRGGRAQDDVDDEVEEPLSGAGRR